MWFDDVLYIWLYTPTTQHSTTYIVRHSSFASGIVLHVHIRVESGHYSMPYDIVSYLICLAVGPVRYASRRCALELTTSQNKLPEQLVL